MEYEGTFLEEFLHSLELIPNDVRRDFELIRELDRETTELEKQLTEKEQAFLERLKTRKRLKTEVDEASKQEDEKFLDEINSLRMRVRQRVSEKTAIAENFKSDSDKIIRKLDANLAFFETELRGSGEFDCNRGILPGTEVAVRTSLLDDNIVLGRILSYYPDIGQYDVADVDDSKRYTVPESQVIALDTDLQRKLTKGEIVYAVYPDTTSFYPAVVIQAPRKSSVTIEPFVLLQFTGDEDETGTVPTKSITIKNVIRMPYLL